jgi:transposase
MLSDCIESVSAREANRSRRQELAQAPRRKYSLAFKLQVVEETFAPGASVTAVALRHNMNTNVVFRWRKLFREGRLTGEAGADKKLLPPPDFIPVRVIADRPSLPAREPARSQESKPPKRGCGQSGGRGMMEITLRCGVVIRVAADVDDEALARVVAAVGDLA